MAKDPVCGMTVEPSKAKGTSAYKGETIYFCNPGCKAKFDRNPEMYMNASAVGTGMAEADTAASGDMAKDLICGMVVPKERSIKTVSSGRTYYFCSEGCLRAFEAPEAELKSLKIRSGFAIAVAIISMAFIWTEPSWLPLVPLTVWLFIITTPVIVFCGKGFFVGGWHALKDRSANMDLLIAMGTTTAYLYSIALTFWPDAIPVVDKTVYYDVASIIIGFILLGKYLEEKIKRRSSEAIRKLLDLRPKTARVIRDGAEAEISAEEIVKGDIVVIKPGETVPADGTVTEGHSAIDEKLITGESIPVDKEAGDPVTGGTLNKTGSFKFRAGRVGSDTTLGQIIRLVEEAQSSSSPIQRLADKVAAYFVPTVVAIALLSLVAWTVHGSFTSGVLAFVAVLIIACPCALGIATPAALMVGVGKGAELGILIRGAEYLERAAKLNCVVFDKTGTLTKGEPEVTKIEAASGVKAEDLLMAASVAEKGSEHPLAEAVLKKAASVGLTIPDAERFEAVPGHGVKAVYGKAEIIIGNRRLMNDIKVDIGSIEAEVIQLEEAGNTVMLVARNNAIYGLIAVADTIKEHAADVVAELKAERIEVVMLTGDNERTARTIAAEAGVDRVVANVLPGGKADVIKELQAAGKVVAMVGDGINDSPALAQADIGIAIGSGSDVAKETGGIILMHDDLRDVMRGIRLARASMRKIKQNLFWAFFYNSVGIPLAAVGIMNPMFAAAAMALSSISVVTNSALLKRVRI